MGEVRGSDVSMSLTRCGFMSINLNFIDMTCDFLAGLSEMVN